MGVHDEVGKPTGENKNVSRIMYGNHVAIIFQHHLPYQVHKFKSHLGMCTLEIEWIQGTVL